MNFSGLFFNTTRWGAAYGGPGGKWSAARVQPTCNSVNEILGVHENRFRGYLPANDDSKGLSYVPDGARLFDTPVGAAQGGAASNGKTDLRRIRNGFQAVWQQNPPRPWFSVIDSNEAHHLSLLLAEQALTDPAVPDPFRRRARIVINFDAHADFPQVARVEPAALRCDNWGLYTVRAVNDINGVIYDPPFADVYVSVGNNIQGKINDWSTSFARLRPPAVTQAQGLPGPRPGDTLEALVNRQVAALATLLMNNSQVMTNNTWNGFDVYITVDRDITQQSYTDYGDGAYPADAVWQFVFAYVNEILGYRTPAFPVTFAGFDICGLPTLGGTSLVGGGGASTESKYAIAFNDIANFANIVRAI